MKYEPPSDPEIILKSEDVTVNENVTVLVDYIKFRANAIEMNCEKHS